MGRGTQNIPRRKTMSSTDDVGSCYTRRCFLSTTLSIASAGAASLLLSHDVAAGTKPPQSKLRTYNGGTDPYPIPWLDKNGSHNQPAGPQLEPSHIYHFKGRVARCADFAGMGTDNRGQPDCVRHTHNRLRIYAGRILCGAHSADRHIHSYMTHPVSGAGCSCKPDSRFSSSHRAFRVVLGGSNF